MSFLQDKHGRYTASLRADLARRGFTDKDKCDIHLFHVFINFMWLCSNEKKM